MASLGSGNRNEDKEDQSAAIPMTSLPPYTTILSEAGGAGLSLDNQRSEELETLSSLGFSPLDCQRGLERGDGTVTGAVEWILNQGEYGSQENKGSSIIDSKDGGNWSQGSNDQSFLAKSEDRKPSAKEMCSDRTDGAALKDKTNLSKEIGFDETNFIPSTMDTWSLQSLVGQASSGCSSQNISVLDTNSFLDNERTSKNPNTDMQAESSMEASRGPRKEALFSQPPLCVNKDHDNDQNCIGDSSRAETIQEFSIGMRLLKHFPGSYSGFYEGSVTKLPRGAEWPYYRIRYLDGVEEDLKEVEVMQCVEEWNRKQVSSTVGMALATPPGGSATGSGEKKNIAAYNLFQYDHQDDQTRIQDHSTLLGCMEYEEEMSAEEEKQETSEITLNPETYSVDECRYVAHIVEESMASYHCDKDILKLKKKGDRRKKNIGTNATAQSEVEDRECKSSSNLFGQQLETTARSRKDSNCDKKVAGAALSVEKDTVGSVPTSSSKNTKKPADAREGGSVMSSKKPSDTVETCPLSGDAAFFPPTGEDGRNRAMNESRRSRNQGGSIIADHYYERQQAGLGFSSLERQPGAYAVSGAAAQGENAAERGELSDLQEGYIDDDNIGAHGLAQQHQNAFNRTPESAAASNMNGHAEFTVTSAEVVIEEDSPQGYNEEDINQQVQQHVAAQLGAMVTPCVVAPVRDESEKNEEEVTDSNLDQGCPGWVEGRKRHVFFVVIFLILVVAVWAGIFSSRRTNLESGEPTPTPTPYSSKEVFLQQVLEDLIGDKIHEAGTPYNQAKNWMLQSDALFLSRNSSLLIGQRYLMALLYFSTTMCEGCSWKKCGPDHYAKNTVCYAKYYDHQFAMEVVFSGTRWLDGNTHECEWFGITCPLSDGDVTEIRLYENNLHGTLPPELALLPSLEWLLLYWNYLTGTIPTEYGSMNSLSDLELDLNELTGTIPDEIYNAVLLTRLDLGGNMLTGTISTRIGNLMRLKGLYLFLTWLSGTIPTEVGLLSQLTNAHFSENPNMTGTIPTEFGNLDLLTELHLDSSSYTGTLPTEIGKMGRLEEFLISNNAFTGNISGISGLNSAVKIVLHSNQFSGSIPEEVYQLENLSVFDASSNSLSGSLASGIENLMSIGELLIADNHFTGTLPNEVFTLDSLYVLDISFNRFGGSISPNVTGLSKLSELLIHDNNLTGSLPLELGYLGNASVILLQNNNITGQIPEEIKELEQLEEFDISKNQLTGPLPEGLFGLESLIYFDCSENELTGTISSTTIMGLGDLVIFNAHGNSFTGQVGSSIGNLTGLVKFNIRSNDLSGSLPDELYNLVHLELLDLSYNRLSGAVSSSIRELENLQVLRLNNNLFNATVPPELAELSNLSELLLHHNNFTGIVSDAFCELYDESFSLHSFYADCSLPNRMNGTPPALLTCDCCTHCCSAYSGECENMVNNLTTIDGS